MGPVGVHVSGMWEAVSENRGRDWCDDVLCRKVQRSWAKEGRGSQEEGKGKWFFSLESLEGTQVYEHLNFSPVRFIEDFWPVEL